MPWPSPPGPRPPHLVWSEASPPRAGTRPEARVRPARRKQPRRGWSPPHAERRLSLSEYYPPRIQKVSIDNDGYAMPATTTILLFALATFLLTVSPGPGVLYVTARSLAQGRRAGFASMFGIEFGEVVWIAAAATGVAALLSASAAALHAQPRRASPHRPSRRRDLRRSGTRRGGKRIQETVDDAGLANGALAAAMMIGIPSTRPRHVSESTMPSARATHRAHGERRATPTMARTASPNRATKTTQRMMPVTKFGSWVAPWLMFWTSPSVPNRLSRPVKPASSPRNTSRNVRRPGEGAHPAPAGGGIT